MVENERSNTVRRAKNCVTRCVTRRVKNEQIADYS